MVASPKNFPLLAELLAEQQQLQTPAARFSETLEEARLLGTEPVYRDLIPLTLPKPGEQYAFEVALDSCTGCKACVSACHSLNGLDDTESWRDTGLVVGGDYRHPFQQTVTTACHHCADPACLNGCPVLAYEKDPVTGIVRHLDDQCIGCQYCVLKCPYDVPKYNARLGIVRKCDMCQSRLAEGEAPACAQACPTHAIRIVTVGVAQKKEVSLASDRARGFGQTDFLRSAPDPSYTRPTTRYLSKREQPADLHAADAATIQPQPAHWPLAWMLTLMPLAVGGHLLSTLLLLCRADSSAFDLLPYSPAVNFTRGDGMPQLTYYVICLAWLGGAAGLAASVAHLGKPGRAWRIFLGWKRSWLSREALAFGGWFGFATLALFAPAFALAAAGAGMLGLFCSVMIYVDTRRRFWRFALTAPRVVCSAIIFGAALAFIFGLERQTSALVLSLFVLIKLMAEARGANAEGWDEDEPSPTAEQKSARLLCGRLRLVFGTRVAVALSCGVVLPWLIIDHMVPQSSAGWMFTAIFIGELVDRSLFFKAVDAPKMPGFPT